MSEYLITVIQHALRVEEGNLADLLKEGWGEDSLPVASAKYNIAMYRTAIIVHKGGHHAKG